MFRLDSTSARVRYMMERLEIKSQSEFGKLCGASRSVVYQWLTGRIKTIDPAFAFKIQDNTEFSARWILLGEGPIKK